ncbi:polysaccharide pyruvyl transferase family protein [uncultured Thomasclavelia sp.]|uniref:polysaccharide pyruvyl transferase family protein n=1 Tax=uncultured Thomasclavelia sp. TaxID=3025759 RepID=UPI002593A903|nr:polysaccharide pyruvyl transferase family protein [uncultured Thomasclavelia sp.]
MKRVGIITLYCNDNYGNKLQNFATKKILTNIGFECDTLVCRGANFPNKKGQIFEFFTTILKKKNNFEKIEKNRESVFKKYNNDNLNIRYIYKTELKKYDYIVIGSDQTWNPYYLTYNKEALYDWFFGMSVDPTKKLPLSPSISVDTIPDEDKERFINCLKSFEHLSIREKQGAYLIEKMTGILPRVICDPTLALSRKEWEKSAIQPNYLPKKKYIFCYFLGGMNDIAKEFINDKTDYEIIDILDKGNPDIYVSNPNNFLWYIKNASFVITDSFHASVFSIIFGKNFYVFDRKGQVNMSSRIVTLLDNFNIMDRYIRSIDELGLKPTKLDNLYNEKILMKLHSEYVSFLKYLK